MSRSKTVGFHVSDSEKASLRRRAGQMNLTVAGYLRRLVERDLDTPKEAPCKQTDNPKPASAKSS